MDTIENILARIQQCRAAVIGDFTLDFYITIDSNNSGQSIETGLPTLPVSSWKTSPGGAGNVAMNLIALGVKMTRVFGVRGDDMFGYQLLNDLEKCNADTAGIVCQKENWNTPVYTKIIHHGKEEKRIDFGNFNSLHKKTADALIDGLESVIAETDIVIINEQLKPGIHTPYFRNRLTKFIKEHPHPIYISDSRNFPESYEGSCRKINIKEALEVLDREKIERKQYTNSDQEIARILYSLWEKPVFLTRGENGIIVYDKTGIHIIPGISLATEVDTVGAGDAALAGISAALGSGFPAADAALLGNLAASVTVQKLHTTGTATKEEILNMEKKAVYSYNPELALDNSKAVFWRNTEIEIIRNPPANEKYHYVLFDHDGTISTLRQGWEQIMEPMMLESITGGRPVPSELYEKIHRKVLDFIERTTGVQTLIQMKGLTELVKEFHLVSGREICNEYEYKKIYNDKLMEMVKKRIKKIRKGELDIHDVTIKNAVPFLEELQNRGMVLFLASGTDERDARNEAELLGYAHFFTGGIFGATGNIQKEPKKKVITSILEKIGRDKSARILTFGDGPVEIAETKRAGGFTIGIASDEIRRYGLNRAKRTRLIKSGVDIIIPDYSQMKNLLSCLFGEKV